MKCNKQKIILRIGISVLFFTTILIMLVAIVERNKQTNDAVSYGKQIVNNVAGNLAGENEVIMQITEDIVNSQVTGDFGNRINTSRELENLLKDNPNIIGAYVAYEPNADGQDNAWLGSPDCNNTGRFLPYWNRLNGSDVIEPLVDMEISDWYLVPKGSMKSAIVEPLYYNGVLMTSYVAPIVLNGDFIGIGGVDRSINDIQKDLLKYKPFKSAKFFLISANGSFLAAPESSYLGKKVNEYPQLQKIFRDSFKIKETDYKTVENPLNKADSWLFSAPIKNSNWTVLMLVDRSEAMEAINKVFAATILLTLIGISLIAFLLRTTSKLYFSEERFSKAFHASPVIMGINNIKDGRFIDVNESFCRILGFSRNEVLGRTKEDIGLRIEPAEGSQAERKLAEKGSFRNEEIYFRTKSGNQRLWLCSSEKIVIQNNICSLNIATDITERKEMEAEILRMDRLNMVGEMAASLAHEIRNPMTSVRGFLQMFEQTYSDNKEILELMIEELDRANAIITEFLSLARNKMVELAPLNLNDIIRKIYPLLKATAISQEKNIIFKKQEVPVLLLDEKEIRQLLINMVKNGLESMAPGGTITIRTYVEDNEAVISFQDQGHGINPEIMEKLGTPFLTTKVQGTGLGLAVCYGIATRHNARINAETSPEGTTFYVRFNIREIK